MKDDKELVHETEKRNYMLENINWSPFEISENNKLKSAPSFSFKSMGLEKAKCCNSSSFAYSEITATKNSPKIILCNINCQFLMVKQVPGNTCALLCPDALSSDLQENILLIIPIFGFCLRISNLV